MHQEIEETQKSSQDGVTAEIFHQLSSTQLAQLAQAITDMFTSLDFETQWTTVAASLVPKKPSPSKLSEVRPISSLSTKRKLLGYVWLAAVGNTPFNSFQTDFLRKTRASELTKEWKTPSVFGTALLREPQYYNSKPVTNASPSRGVSHREPQSRLQSLWLFLIKSWGTWMLCGETETSSGKWTTSTSRALLTLTTSVFCRQAKNILSLWSGNALTASWLQAWNVPGQNLLDQHDTLTKRQPER